MRNDRWTHEALNYTQKTQRLEIFTFQGHNMECDSVQVRDTAKPNPDTLRRLSIHIPYSIQARMEYGIWNAPRMEYKK
jgi:hypothetical protein